MSDLKEGLTTKSPPPPTAKPQGGNVKDGATRDSVAKSHSLGGRTA